MHTIPAAPVSAPDSIRSGLTAAAQAWYEDPIRPRADSSVLEHWSRVLDEWIASDLPMFIRKSRDNRGHLLQHSSGRGLVPADNGPAHWSLTLALTDQTPTLADIRAIIERDEIPVAMVFKKSEKGGRYQCRVAMKDGPNARGWKVAHIESVGLGNTGAIEQLPLEVLSAHFKRFLSPANMFCVPQDYAGVAETPEFISVFRNAGRII